MGKHILLISRINSNFQYQTFWYLIFSYFVSVAHWNLTAIGKSESHLSTRLNAEWNKIWIKFRSDKTVFDCRRFLDYETGLRSKVLKLIKRQFLWFKTLGHLFAEVKSSVNFLWQNFATRQNLSWFQQTNSEFFCNIFNFCTNFQKDQSEI